MGEVHFAKLEFRDLSEKSWWKKHNEDKKSLSQPLTEQ